MKRLALCCVLAAALVACSGSKEADTAKATADAGAAIEQAVKDAAAGKMSNVKVVPFESLLPFLPDMPGWTKGEPKGETDNAMGINVSRVQVDYDKGESTMSFEIMDSSMNPAILTPFTMAAKAGLEERTAEGYTKSTMVAGYPAVEEWTPEAKNGSVGLLVGGRYLVKVTGSTVADVETIRKAVQAVDLRKLAALK